MKRRKGLLDEEKFLPPLPEQLPRGVSSLPGYGQTSPVAQGLLGFTGRNPTYSVMDPQAQQMSDAYRLGEQASVASQLYGSVLPFAAASTMASAQRAGSLLSPLTVFHGSPHKFSKFDASKIGTGEGAQAYGHGLYFAENPRVADEYRMMLSTHKLTGEAAQDLANYSLRMKPTVEEAINYLQKEKKTAINQSKSSSNEFATNEYVKQYDDAINLLKSNKGEKPGSLYTVDLPDEQIAKMLDWDKPLGKQSKEVQKAIAQTRSALPQNAIDDLGGDLSLMYGPNVTPEQFLNTWESLGLRNAGEAALQKAGIPGIRYLDAGSRSKGGTSNFVVFPGEESKLRIMEVNGKPVVIDEEELRRSGLLGVAQ